MKVLLLQAAAVSARFAHSPPGAVCRFSCVRASLWWFAVTIATIVRSSWSADHVPITAEACVGVAGCHWRDCMPELP
jgi:hypothetical protein